MFIEWFVFLEASFATEGSRTCYEMPYKTARAPRRKNYPQKPGGVQRLRTSSRAGYHHVTKISQSK
jgi:hypothetical protein